MHNTTVMSELSQTKEARLIDTEEEPSPTPLLVGKGAEHCVESEVSILTSPEQNTVTSKTSASQVHLHPYVYMGEQIRPRDKKKSDSRNDGRILKRLLVFFFNHFLLGRISPTISLSFTTNERLHRKTSTRPVEDIDGESSESTTTALSPSIILYMKSKKPCSSKALKDTAQNISESGVRSRDNQKIYKSQKQEGIEICPR